MYSTSCFGITVKEISQIELTLFAHIQIRPIRRILFYTDTKPVAKASATNSHHLTSAVKSFSRVLST